VNQNSDHETIEQEFETLRNSLKTVQLATVDSQGNPESSYAPYVWIEQCCYLYLSELARHSTNLIANPAISLLFIEDEEKARNLFARRRIILTGEVHKISRESGQFQTVMNEFKLRFGNFIDIIEPLQDFHLFQIIPQSGRFIRGFAQAFELTGPGLGQIAHINPGN
jgi:putative heme iron utilization protein